jgi:hypothetical protein
MLSETLTLIGNFSSISEVKGLSYFYYRSCEVRAQWTIMQLVHYIILECTFHSHFQVNQICETLLTIFCGTFRERCETNLFLKHIWYLDLHSLYPLA